MSVVEGQASLLERVCVALCFIDLVFKRTCTKCMANRSRFVHTETSYVSSSACSL